MKKINKFDIILYFFHFFILSESERESMESESEKHWRALKIFFIILRSMLELYPRVFFLNLNGASVKKSSLNFPTCQNYEIY